MKKDNFDMKIVLGMKSVFSNNAPWYGSCDGFQLKDNLQNLSEAHGYLKVPISSMWLYMSLCIILIKH